MTTKIKSEKNKESKIKEGYKKTKLGWIPEDWEFKLLDEVSKRGSGHTPNKKKEEYYNGGIKWISLADSSKLDKGLISETENDISELGIKNSSAVIHKKNTVLLSRDAGVGKSAVMYEDMAVSQHFIAWYTNESLCHYWFLYYLLQKNKREFERVAVGSTIKTIGLGYFKKLKIPLPSLPEQKKIADILSIWDKAIETTQALIKKLQLRKKGLMQQLLTGKKRLPGFSEEWEELKFSDVANRLTKKNEELHDNVVTISAQRGFVRQEDYFNKRVASKTLSGYYLVNNGDFCYNKSYSKGYPMGAFKRLDDFEKAVVTTLYICFRLTEKVSSDFMVNYFEGGMIVNNLMKIAQEGGRAHGLLNISLGDFFGLKMTLPKIKEQTAIAQVLNEADKEINQIQNYLEQLQEQKKGLMQQLLTGQKRVKV